MRLRVFAVTIAAYLVTSGAAAAQMSVVPPSPSPAFTDPANGLSLDQAIDRALAHEPALRAARSNVEIARGARLQAGLRSNPSLSVERREEPAGTDNQTMINVQWPLDLFRRGARIAVAAREVTAAELSIADRERVLAADVRARYGDLLVAVRELMISEQLVAAVRRQHDLLSARVAEGAAPPLERDLLEVERGRLEADRLRQLGIAEAAMFTLRRLLGAEPDAPILVRDTLEDLVNRESTPEATRPGAESVAQRQDVREADARVAVAEARIEQVTQEGRFDLSVFGGLMRMDAGFPQTGFSVQGTPERVRGRFTYFAFGAMVTVPVFNRNQGEIVSARATHEGSIATDAAVRLSAQAEIAAARALDQRAREAVKLYGRGIRALAQRNLTVTSETYNLGRATAFEVLAAQRQYLELERSYTDALSSAYEARTLLNRALGELR